MKPAENVYVSYEIRKLADLVEDGHLTEQEFREHKIFDEAGAVMFLIPCVKALQVLARETCAFITKPNAILLKQVAAFLKRAFFTAGATSSAIWYFHPYALYIVSACKVTTAHRAVHATRRDGFKIIRKNIRHRI